MRSLSIAESFESPKSNSIFKWLGKLLKDEFPANIYFPKVTIETLEKGVFIVNFEHILTLF